MKLWMKISLVCTSILLLIVSICCALLFVYSRERIISVAMESTVAQQEDLARSFSQMVNYYSKDDIAPIAKRSLALYCFKQFANDTSVLKSDGEILYSNVGFDPEPLVSTMDTGRQLYTGVVNGRALLITASQVTLLKQTYSVFVIRDITEVHRSLSLMLWKFIAIGFAGIAVGTVLVGILVRFFTKPLKSLELSSRRIAQGEYSERVSVPAKDEIAQLALDFNKMAQAVESNYRELKEMTERQQMFIGSLTHEFKTPLTSVIGHSETLLCINMPPDVVNDSLLHIYEQCRWLEHLTQKLLKLITLQEEICIKNESVPALLDTLQGHMRESLNKRHIGLNVNCNIESLPVDGDLLLSLLVNLVDNAAKASNDGQTIDINAYDSTLEIVDHGIGIPEEELQHITEPFYMVDKSRSKKMGGSGLGLALAKEIADAHGAQLLFSSEPGRGTSVKVLFPR